MRSSVGDGVVVVVVVVVHVGVGLVDATGDSTSLQRFPVQQKMASRLRRLCSQGLLGVEHPCWKMTSSLVFLRTLQ